MRRIAVWLLGLALAVLVIVRTPIGTDMSAFLPRSPLPAQQLLVDQLREGVVSRMVLVGLSDADPAALATLSRNLAARLRADPGFSLVANGDPAAQTREAAILLRHRYLLSPAVTADRFSEAGLRTALEADIDLLGSEMAPIIKRTLPSDPTGETLLLLQDLSGRAHPASVDGVWFSRSGTTALLTVSTRAAGFDIDGQQRGLDRIRAEFAAARLQVPNAGSASLMLTGPPVFAAATRARIQGDAERLSIIATLLVAGVLMLAYRSIRMLALGLLPVASGALAGIAAVSLVFGFVHGITLGFGVTLIGEAVDYAVYLFTQTPPGGAPRATLPRIWPTLRLGMATSVCGFSAMLFSRFTGFAQLGLFTIAGLLTALAVTRFVLPELLPVAFVSKGSTTLARPLLAMMRNRARLRWVVLAATLVAVGSLALHRGPFWEDELSSMSPIPADELAQDARLRGELGVSDVRNLVVVEGPDAEAALVASEAASARLEALVASGIIGGYDAPSRLLPSQAIQRARQAALPAPKELQERFAAAAAGTILRPDIFAPFLADVEQARTGALLRHADLEGSGLALQVDSLLIRRGSAWFGLLPLRQVRDPAALAGEVARWNGASLVDLKRQSDDLLGSFRGEAASLSLVGSLVILALLAVSLRSTGRVVRIVLPLVASVLCTAAILLAASQRLSIFNLFGFLLVVAVGSNYCLFFEREAAGDAGLELPRLVTSLVLANLCTVIGFGILSVSLVPVLHGIGSTVALGAFASLLFGAVLSPRRPA